MKIHKLLYRKTSESELIELCFTEHTSNYENCWIINQSSNEIEWIYAAITDCFSVNPIGKNFYVRLELYEKHGVEWSIEINKTHRNIMKNNRSLPAESQLSQLLSVINDNNQIDFNHLYNSHYLSAVENNLFTFKNREEGIVFKGLNETLKKRKKLLSEDIFESFKDLKALSSKDQVDAVQKLSKLHSEFHLLNNEYRNYKSQIDNKIYFAEKFEHDYQYQLDIIEKVEVIYKQLSKPSSSIQTYKEKIQAVDTEINELLITMQIDKVPSFQDIPDWNHVFHILCRFQILEKLTRFTEKATNLAKENVNPLVESFLVSLEKLVRKQSQYASEIESCISSVNVQLASQNMEITLDHHGRNEKHQTQDEKIDSVMNWFDKLKSKLAQEELIPKSTINEEKKENLESLRMSLEYLLDRFSEVQVSLAQIKNYNQNEYLDELEHQYEKQLEALGKVKVEWKKIAQELNLPFKMTIKQLMLVSLNYMRIVELNERKKILNDTIEERLSQVQLLTSLVQEWRKSIKSQKDMDLENTAILMAEARSIILYKTERSKKADYQSQALNEQKDDQRLLVVFKKRIDALREEWDTVCEGYHIKDMMITDHQLEKIVEYKTRILEILDVGQFIKPTQLSDALIASRNCGINIWVWNETITMNKSRITFLNSVEENHVGNGINLYLFEDETLSEFFMKMGAGMTKGMPKKVQPQININPEGAKKITIEDKLNPPLTNATIQSPTLQKRIIKNHEIKVQPAPVQPVKPVPSIPAMSPRAKAVLDLLNNRRGG